MKLLSKREAEGLVKNAAAVAIIEPTVAAIQAATANNRGAIVMILVKT